MAIEGAVSTFRPPQFVFLTSPGAVSGVPRLGVVVGIIGYFSDCNGGGSIRISDDLHCRWLGRAINSEKIGVAPKEGEG
jgi:hypothetical protein